MERVNKIVQDPCYQDYLVKIAALEEKRTYCRHDFQHFVAAARIAYLTYLEEGGTGLSKEVIYAAALLHDIGRLSQYEQGREHEFAGAELAAPILARTGFSREESREILTAIKEHGFESKERLSTPLAYYLWEGDKKSRLCFMCKKEGCRSKKTMPHFLMFQV